ncbi:MAG: GNAT family N-acetyltransferase [Candidatus Eremiobacteraeota bacterium]|nr:GNAT family N-acetyltransferase [Candidatus Eremiobacteraeota bacterium]
MHETSPSERASSLSDASPGGRDDAADQASPADELLSIAATSPRDGTSLADEASFYVEVVQPDRTAAFRRSHEREALSTQWNFTVVWHEQRHEIAALQDGAIIGVLGLRIAASLAHVDSLIVAPEQRRVGVAGALVGRAESLANYYNCHKVTLETPAVGAVRTFFEACGYRCEAVLAQHTWKRDVAVLRKFLL